jgi:hypothetical protein
MSLKQLLCSLIMMWKNQLNWIYATFCEPIVDGYLDYGTVKESVFW